MKYAILAPQIFPSDLQHIFSFDTNSKCAEWNGGLEYRKVYIKFTGAQDNVFK
jgi:hypothetical protein